MKFGEKLQKMRKEKGLSQEALAEMLDVSRQAVSKWESGQSYPETDKLIIISEIFGVTVDGLLKEGDTEENLSADSAMFWMTRGSVFEYKSTRTMGGLPLVHINIGFLPRKAKGVLAIGNIATGVLSVGLIAKGILSIGLLSMGLIGIGTLSLAILAVGALSVGIFSLGALSVGIFTLGAMSIGMYSVGAYSVAARVAIGDHAYGHIAAGRVVGGAIEFIDTSLSAISGEEVRRAIMEEFPNTPNRVISWLTSFLGR